MEQSNLSFQVLHNEETSFLLEPSLVIVFALHGSCTIHELDTEVVLPAAGIYAINPLTLYQISCDENTGIICMRLAPELLQAAGWTEDTALHLNLPEADPADAVQMELRQQYAWLFYTFFQNGNETQMFRRALDLVNLLLLNFQINGQRARTGSTETMKRLQDILRIMHKQWREPLSLAEVAAQQYVSNGYLSRLFRKYMGMTFNDYLVSIRLKHAQHDLQTTEKSITDIAYENGFKNVNLFISYFKKHYLATPGQYRQQSKDQKQTTAERQEDVSDWLQTLLRYVPDVESTSVQEPVREFQGRVNVSRRGTSLQHSWNRLMNIGYARDGLISTVQKQIQRAKTEIGFTYLRFHGIFDDDMHIYQVKQDGSSWYNFTYADLLFDFILSVGLLPFVELGFMPSRLAKTKNPLYDRGSIISIYNDVEGWEALVQATIAHWIERYGLDEVRKWRFTTFSINYAGLPDIPFSYQDYRDLYVTTYRVVKGLDAQLKFGGFGGFVDITLSEDPGQRFLHDMQQCGCMPDFFTAQCYPHENILSDREFLHFTASQESTPSVLSRDTDFTEHFLQQLKDMLVHQGMSSAEIVLEEWRPTLWQRDLSCDTCYTAAWFVKNVFACSRLAGMMGYWLLTDFLEEWQVPGGVFYGGYGLFTVNGIPKAGYQALRLLALAGDEQLANGDGWVVTRKQDEIQIYLYHYCHYDAFYRYRYQKLRNPHDAYTVFERSTPLHITLELLGLPIGDYRQERYR